MGEGNGKTVSAEEMIDSQVRQVLGVVIRGLMVSAPGVPAQMLACSIARITAEMISNGMAGDLAAKASAATSGQSPSQSANTIIVHNVLSFLCAARRTCLTFDSSFRNRSPEWEA